MCINKSTLEKVSKNAIVLSRAEAEKIKGGTWVCSKCKLRDTDKWSHACTVLELDINR